MSNPIPDDEVAFAKAKALLSVTKLSKAHLTRALTSNQQYLKLIERHLTAVDNMLEANMEKKNLIWQLTTSSVKSRVPPAVRRAVLSLPRFTDMRGNEPPPNRDTIEKQKLLKTIPLIPRPVRWTKEELGTLNEAVQYASLQRAFAKLMRLRVKQNDDMKTTNTHITQGESKSQGQVGEKENPPNDTLSFRLYYDSDDESDAPLMDAARNAYYKSNNNQTHSSAEEPMTKPNLNVAWFSLINGVFPNSFASVFDIDNMPPDVELADLVTSPPKADVVRTLLIVESLIGRDPELSYNAETSSETSQKTLIDQVKIDPTRINWSYIAHHYIKGKSGINCYLRWMNVQDPAINNAAWTKEEVLKITPIIKKFSARNWTEIARELGTNRTPLECLRMYQRKLSTRQQPLMDVSPSELPYMAQLYVLFGEDWSRISYEMPTYSSPNQLLLRWNKYASGAIRSGAWTKEEDARLFLAVRAYTTFSDKAGPQDSEEEKGQESQVQQRGTRTFDEIVQKGGTVRISWNKVRQHIPGRSDVQCRSRYMNVMKRVGNTEWTKEADDAILELGPECFFSWTKMSIELEKKGLGFYDPINVKKRWFAIASSDAHSLLSRRKLEIK